VRLAVLARALSRSHLAQAGVYRLTASAAAFVDEDESMQSNDSRERAIFGGGCFWCTEAVFRDLRGVERVVSGYSGGARANPSYEQVCSGATGHTEVVQIEYDPRQISFRDLLQVFFATHDPTTPNRQGNDVGSQYRSVVFYESAEQQRTAQAVVDELSAAGAFERPIVTEISPLNAFYPAEAYHQEYFERNPHQPYCQVVVAPKLAKFRKQYAERLKQ
jgi:peptide-methionine (S)-S-oxide reductase